MDVKLTEKQGEFLVGLALALRGSSLLFAKIAMQTMGPFLLMGTRFLIAFILIGALFRKNVISVTKQELMHCALLGFIFLISIAFELYGLRTTPSTVTSFLEGGVVLMVPVLTCIVQRKLPDRATVISAVIAMVGIAFLTLKGDHLGFTRGELLVLGGAMWYSVSVLITDKAAKNDNPMTVAVYQLLFIGLFSMAAAFLFEEVRLPSSATEWGAILALAVICSGVGFTLQPLGQKYTTPERAGLLVVFNPLTATALGMLFLGERLTWTIVAGAVLIIASILSPAWLNRNRS